MRVFGAGLAAAGVRLGIPEWHDLAAFTHAWSVRDATLGTATAAQQSEYGITGATRVTFIPDRIGTKHLYDDTQWGGVHAATYTGVQPCPGPLHIASSDRFNGHPAVRFDKLKEVGETNDLYAILTPVDYTDDTTYFNATGGYPAPWSCVMLGRPVTAVGQHADAGLWDSTLGGPGQTASTTIHAGRFFTAALDWEAANWANGSASNRLTLTHDASVDETVLLVWHTSSVAGSSWFEANWKDSSGALQTERVTGTLNAHTFREFFLGWVHKFYFAFGGTKTSEWTAAEVDRMRSYAAQYMPAAASLVEEP